MHTNITNCNSDGSQKIIIIKLINDSIINMLYTKFLTSTPHIKYASPAYANKYVFSCFPVKWKKHSYVNDQLKI